MGKDDRRHILRPLFSSVFAADFQAIPHSTLIPGSLKAVPCRSHPSGTEASPTAAPDIFIKEYRDFAISSHVSRET